MIDIKEEKYTCHSCNKTVTKENIKNKPSIFFANYCKDCGVRCNYCQISLKILGFTKDTVLDHTKICKEKEKFDNNQNDYYWDDPHV